MKNVLRTKQIHFRVTEDEFNTLRCNAAPFGSVANYIRCALSEHSNTTARDKLEHITSLSGMLVKYDSMLFHTTSNLNQALKHANELYIAGLLSKSYYQSVVCANIEETKNAISIVRGALKDIAQSLTKYNL